ncbi:MAG TPA: flippase, partial [Candidatus Desulfofervidus auxilii]|nr:flippase [Candidatus Desulfofervidus auxilii]
MIDKIKTKLSEDIHFKELIQGSLTFLILRILGMIVGYTFTLFVTRTFGASAWGIFALSFTVLQITSVIGKLGLDTALLRFIAQYNAQGKVKTAKYIYIKSIIIIVSLSFLLFIFLYYLSSLLAEKVFGKPHLAPYFKLISFALLPFVLLSINLESLRAFKKIKEYTTLQIFLPFLFALIFFSISFYILNIKNIKVIIIAYILGIGISFFLSFLLLNKEFSNKNGELEKVSLSQILSVSLPMLLTSSLFMVMSWTDTIMLGIWRTEKEVGIYNVAVRLSMITSFTLGAINSIAAPKFAEFWGKNDLEGLKKIAQQSTKLIFWTSTPILILYILFPKFFMGIFGKEFREGALALVFLTIGQFVNASVGSVGYILQMTDKQKIFQNVVLIGSIINIILNIILIPTFGGTGAAIASAIAISFINIVPFFLIRYYYGFFT